MSEVAPSNDLPIFLNDLPTAAWGGGPAQFGPNPARGRSPLCYVDPAARQSTSALAWLYSESNFREGGGARPALPSNRILSAFFKAARPFGPNPSILPIHSTLAKYPTPPVASGQDGCGPTVWVRPAGLPAAEEPDGSSEAPLRGAPGRTRTSTSHPPFHGSAKGHKGSQPPI